MLDEGLNSDGCLGLRTDMMVVGNRCLEEFLLGERDRNDVTIVLVCSESFNLLFAKELQISEACVV